MDNQIIFILDDEHSICGILKEYLNKKLDNVEIYIFTKYEDLKKHNLLKHVALFIFDINLENHLTGDQVAMVIHEQNPAPFLFMSGRGYTFESFLDKDITYDYLSKPFDLDRSLNRIKLLLKVSQTYMEKEKEKENFQISIKHVFDYTNIYMVILDINMKVKLCSSILAKDLGYENESELNGVDWKKHLSPLDAKVISKALKSLNRDDTKTEETLKEFSNEIFTKDKKPINVKWFNTKLTNGQLYSFSMGIPFDKQISSSDDMSTIRAHWRDIIDRNTTTLKTLKSRI